MIKHSPAAIADSSLFLPRESRRSIRNAGFRRPCDVSRVEPNERRTETRTAEVMTPPATVEMAEADIPRDRASSTRRFAPIAVGLPRYRSFPGPTNRCTAATAFNPCAASSNRDIRNTSSAFSVRSSKRGWNHPAAFVFIRSRSPRWHPVEAAEGTK